MLVGVILVLLIAFGVWWSFLGTAEHNLLLITLDTTRADHLGCYGFATARTPIIDQLAQRGILYEHAYTAVPITLPSHATMLTGLLPPEHGIRINGSNELPRSVTTLTGNLRWPWLSNCRICLVLGSGFAFWAEPRLRRL